MTSPKIDGLSSFFDLVLASGSGRESISQSLVWFPEPEIRKIEGAGNHTSDWKICFCPDPLAKTRPEKHQATHCFYKLTGNPADTQRTSL
jgi:hypothetical protein